MHIAALESHLHIAQLLAEQVAKRAIGPPTRGGRGGGASSGTAAVAALLSPVDVLGRSPLDYEPRLGCLLTLSLTDQEQRPCDFRESASKTAYGPPPSSSIPPTHPPFFAPPAPPARPSSLRFPLLPPDSPVIVRASDQGMLR